MKVAVAGTRHCGPRLATVTRFEGAALQTRRSQARQFGFVLFYLFSTRPWFVSKRAVCDLVGDGRGVNQWLRISNDALSVVGLMDSVHARRSRGRSWLLRCATSWPATTTWSYSPSRSRLLTLSAGEGGETVLCFHHCSNLGDEETYTCRLER